MTIDNTIPNGAPGIAAFASETFGGPAEPRYGEGVPTTVSRMVTASGDVDLPLYSVVSIAGGVIALAKAVSAAGFALGTATFASTGPANGQTATIGDQTYTFVTALTPTANEIEIGGTTTELAAKLAAAINGDTLAGVAAGTVANGEVVASASGAVTTVTALVAGDEGNAVAFENVDLANTTFSPGADVLGGGTDDTDDRPYGILATAVVLADGDSMSVPIYREGHWDMRALTFDATFLHDDQKIRAFEGSLSPTIYISKGKHGPDAIDV